jgi:DNA polymerase elongation subunit (family B)
MELLAKNYDFEIIAGDTDSLFLSDGDHDLLQKFVVKCQEELGVKVEHQKPYSKFANIKKKHYVGVDSVTGDVTIKGMEGKKSDRPKWVNDAFDAFV